MKTNKPALASLAISMLKESKKSINKAMRHVYIKDGKCYITSNGMQVLIAPPEMIVNSFNDVEDGFYDIAVSDGKYLFVPVQCDSVFPNVDAVNPVTLKAEVYFEIMLTPDDFNLDSCIAALSMAMIERNKSNNQTFSGWHFVDPVVNKIVCDTKMRWKATIYKNSSFLVLSSTDAVIICQTKMLRIISSLTDEQRNCIGIQLV